uniref:HGGxSTG domain-containing protein n=1 Tax=Limnohabitans sp. TaxID=1907725 RepID=UPI004048B101
MICGAKTRSDAPCQKAPLIGKTRCRLHGGLSLSGINHPNYRHGRCTKQARQESAEITVYVRYLELLAIRFGMIEPKYR